MPSAFTPHEWSRIEAILDEVQDYASPFVNIPI